MKHKDLVDSITILFLSLIVACCVIYPLKFYRTKKELDRTIKENIELKQEVDELEKENYKLNFEKSLERTCGLQSVQCDNE